MVEMELVAECDGYELVKDIGWGSFGVAKLMRDRITMELVAVKFIERGDKIDQNVRREVINHRSLRHPNIIRFKEVALTPTHLAIIMEYASGGELFARILDAGRVGEDEARYFFQQLISGVSYFHSMEVCHRDLKLENMLLDGSTAPQLKICDFGYSKSSVLDSQPNSTVGTPSYLAPEIISAKEYDGKCADVWSCGVTLYIMLVGTYPFGDPGDITKTILRILDIQYSFPDSLHISPECKDLISRIFVDKPAMRMTIPEIQKHTWFRKNLPVDLMKDNSTNNPYEELDQPMQNLGKINQIITEATLPSFLTQSTLSPMDSMDDEEIDADLELVPDSSGEVVHAM